MQKPIIIRLTFTRGIRDEHRTCITSIKRMNEKFGYFEFGHPYDVDTKQTFAGEVVLYPAEDSMQMTPASEQETLCWYKNYMEFHDSVVREKGYDVCEEDVRGFSDININGKDNC